MSIRTSLSRGYLLAFLACFSLVGSSLAQRGGGSGSVLKTGSDLPKVKAYNAEGEAVELREAVKGKHAVIVFGCLT